MSEEHLSDALLGRLFQYHPDHALAYLKGVSLPPNIDEFNPPKVPEPTVPVAKLDTVRNIIRVVAKHYEVNVEALLSPSKARFLFEPRLVCYYLAYKLPHVTSGMAADYFRRDSSSIRAGVRSLKKKMAKDPFLARLVRTLEQEASKCQ